MTRVSAAVATPLAAIDAMHGMKCGAQYQGKAALYRRLECFEDAYKAATSAAAACALVDRIIACDPTDISQALSRHDFARLIARVRNEIPTATRDALLARLEAEVQRNGGLAPLIVALAPDHHSALFSGFRPNENLLHSTGPFVSASLTSALAALPELYAEQTRQALIAGMNAAACAKDGDLGTTAGGAASRRNHELLLTRLARNDVQTLIEGLPSCDTNEVCARIDALHAKLFAGVTTDRGNPGFARVLEAARILQKNLPLLAKRDAKDDDDPFENGGVYIGGSVTNAKWRPSSSDVDINFDPRVALRVLNTTYDSWKDKHNAVADWLRDAEPQIAKVFGVERTEGELLSLAFVRDYEGTPRPSGPSLFGLTGYFGVRITRKAIELVVFNPDDPDGPFLYQRPL